MISGYTGAYRSSDRFISCTRIERARRDGRASQYLSIFGGHSFPKWLRRGARTRDGIRSARINKFAKALLLCAAAAHETLRRPFRYRWGVCPVESRLFIRSIRPELKVFFALSTRHSCKELGRRKYYAYGNFPWNVLCRTFNWYLFFFHATQISIGYSISKYLATSDFVNTIVIF